MMTITDIQKNQIWSPLPHKKKSLELVRISQFRVGSKI